MVIPVYIMKQRFKLRSEHHWPRALGSALTENIDYIACFILDQLETMFNL